jgi:ribonuclease-3
MDRIEQSISYHFKNKKLLIDAVNHSSMKKFAVSFERLEFLGDRVLGLVIAEYIFKNFNNDEGEMARMQSSLICANSCYSVAINIGLDNVINTAGNHLRTNKTVLADGMEALIGAVFIDSNYDTIKCIILNLWGTLINQYDRTKQDPKTQLQELSQAKYGNTPVYKLISTKGPDHQPVFEVSVTGFGKTIYSSGNSIKIAETNAAKALLEELNDKSAS